MNTENNQKMKNLVIIGTGLAGYNLAKEWRKYDQDSTLTILSGDEGSFYSKPMLSTALAQKKSPDDLPISLIEKLRADLNARIEPYTWVDKIDLEAKKIFFGEESLEYTQLVLATGASPLKPKWTGNGLEAIHTVNNLQDYQKFRQELERITSTKKAKILIIGSGLVGCEFANDLSLSGHAVEVVSLEKSPLARLVPDFIGQNLSKALAATGVAWHFEASVAHIDLNKDKIFQVRLNSGEVLEADLVLSACGLASETKLAAQAGLKVERGICVSNLLETSHKNVYAIGDCAEVAGQILYYVSPLMQGVRALAQTLSGTPSPVTYPALPVGIKTSAYPLLVCIPPHAQNPQGIANLDWRIDAQEGEHFKLSAWNKDNQRVGFVLTGPFLKERLSCVEGLAPFLA
jgi:rubredoxin-NAD+ reductase